MHVTVRNITKVYQTSFQSNTVLKNISVSIEAGEFVAIMGPSGAGKSTLLNIIGTLDQPTKGEVFIDHKATSVMNDFESALFRRMHLGFVFQDIHLLESYSVEDNIKLPLILNKTPINEIQTRYVRLMEMFNLVRFKDKYPNELSGGEKQRVAIVRALMNYSKLILADEPTGSLDSHHAQLVMKDLVSLNEQLNNTIIMVTHSSQVASYASRVLFIKDGSIYTQIHRKDLTQAAFFEHIVETLTVMAKCDDSVDIS